MITTNNNIILIGDWDMNFSAAGSITKSVSHNLGSINYKKIRNISVVIRDDNDVVYYSFSSSQNSSTAAITSTQFILTQTSPSGFDSATFNATSYNRGWITYDLE